MARGAWARIAGTASAASATSGYPSTTSAWACATGTSLTVAPSIVTTVPSVPASVLARLAPFSGSRCSREYPDTWRRSRPNSVRSMARFDETSESRPGTGSRPRPAVKRRPVPSTTSSSSTLSAVRP